MVIKERIGAKQVLDLIDGGGIYSSRVARGGDWVFFSGSAVDAMGRVRGPDSLPAAYRSSPIAQVRSQTEYMFERFADAFGTLDLEFEDVVQIEQYIKRKVQHDGYLEVSRSEKGFARRRPGSLLLQAGDYLPEEAVVAVNGIAHLRSEEYPAKEIFRTDLTYAHPKHQLDFDLPVDRYPQFDTPRSEEAPYSEVVVAGEYVFNTVLASDYHTGPREDIRIGSWSSWGNEMRNEATWMVMALDKKLQAGGARIEDVVHCSAFIQELGDLYELDRVWAKLFPENPPARTIVPIRGLGQPRIEGAKHHWEGTMKMELQFRTMVQGRGATRQAISLPGAALPDVESDAVRVGNLLWIGGQIAADRDGPVTAPDTGLQLDYIFGRLASICEDGGSSLADLLRIRAFVTDERTGYAFYAKLKEMVPVDPPVVCVIVVPDPLHVPSCTVSIDAVALSL
jgi:enamine deaminase RidA (YjgF/YER057c/UK114 family)